jgi:hypothetical protein
MSIRVSAVHEHHLDAVLDGRRLAKLCTHGFDVLVELRGAVRQSFVGADRRQRIPLGLLLAFPLTAVRARPTKEGEPLEEATRRRT